MYRMKVGTDSAIEGIKFIGWLHQPIQICGEIMVTKKNIGLNQIGTHCSKKTFLYARNWSQKDLIAITFSHS